MRQVNKIRRRLKAVMKENGHSQGELAYRLNINKSTISLFLRGKTGAGGPHLVSILEYCFPTFKEELEKL